MATRSAIALRVHDNQLMTVYCHWDGYPSYNGKLLSENYNAPSKIASLLLRGDISSLGPTIGEKHNFNTFGMTPEEKANCENMTTFYGRDRGEKGCDFRLFDTVEEYISHYDSAGAEYYYLYENGQWLVSAHGDDFQNLNDLLLEENA